MKNLISIYANNTEIKQNIEFNFSLFCWAAKCIKELNKLFDKYLTD